jgi:hypothetical protein
MSRDARDTGDKRGGRRSTKEEDIGRDRHI